jgi:hypothetical protein
MTFEEWLEKEFPAHSPYDFENLSKYKRWLYEMEKAWNAGYRQHYDDMMEDTYG